MKKAQIIGQVFMFVLAAFIFSMILTYGYIYIDKIMVEQKKVALIDFKQSLEKDIQNIQYLQGSVRKIKLDSPGDYSEVCFADSKNSENNQKFPLLAHINRLDGQNVFLLPLPEIKIKLKNIRVNYEGNTICCLPLENTLILKLESTKEGVFISPWEDYLSCK